MSVLDELTDKQRKELREMVMGMKKLRKPEHGNCCTCQVCGYDHDDCKCELNSRVETIADLFGKVE